jgi:hypothetical protein
VVELVKAELISLPIGTPHPNPFIKAFRAPPVEAQLDGLADLAVRLTLLLRAT